MTLGPPSADQRKRKSSRSVFGPHSLYGVLCGETMFGEEHSGAESQLIFGWVLANDRNPLPQQKVSTRSMFGEIVSGN